MKPLGESEPKGWVLYDGACGFCSRWVPFWGNTLENRGFLIAPLQSDWVAGKLHLSDKELASDFRLLLTDGEQLAGAAAYRYLSDASAGLRRFICSPSCRFFGLCSTSATGSSRTTVSGYRAAATCLGEPKRNSPARK